MSATHTISLVRHHPHPALAGVVAGMVGISEEAHGTVQRRQPAGSLIPLVLSFGPPLEVLSLSEGVDAGQWYGSFAAGFTSGYATTRFENSQDSIQVYLSPAGMTRILGIPGRTLAGRVVQAGDLACELGEELSDRLKTLNTWKQRFALVEERLLGLTQRRHDTPTWVDWMWEEIRAHGGQVRIADLVAQTGWSHRYVASVFTQVVGLSPKRAADIVRFERAASDLGSMPIASVAAQHGYADQSHLHRAFRRHAGEPPREYVAAQRPTPLTALGRPRTPRATPVTKRFTP